MEHLVRIGFEVEVFCGTIVDAASHGDPSELLSAQDLSFEEAECDLPEAGASGSWSAPLHLLRTVLEGVPITIHQRALKRYGPPDSEEVEGFLFLLDSALLRFRPDVLITYGSDPLTREILARARRSGVITVFPLHNFGYSRPDTFSEVDAVLVASRYSAEYHRRALGIECTVLPNLIDWNRVQAERSGPGFVTFVNPSPEKGVYVFARLADEMGRQRPDIPLLVVESRGTEQTLAACGLDLRVHGNVYVLRQTPDPREFWRLTRLVLLPSLWWENQPLVAVEAMINGVPVIGSDRGGIPETLGQSGVLLPLPNRLTAATRQLPTTEEVVPWIKEISRLWDDGDEYARHRRSALLEAERWRTERLGPQYGLFFERVQRRVRSLAVESLSARWIALVPFTASISRRCEEALHGLGEVGVHVVRRQCRDLDAGRNELLSGAVYDGADSIVLIDPDLVFDPIDVRRILARPEPVVAGLVPRDDKSGEFEGSFPPDNPAPIIGRDTLGLFPLEWAGIGFIRIHVKVLKSMIATLSLPVCRTQEGQSFWPFIQPLAIVTGEGAPLNLNREEAFAYRLREMGITLMADTSLRLISDRPGDDESNHRRESGGRVIPDHE